MLFGEVTQENVYITHSVGLHAEICHTPISRLGDYMSD